MQLPIDEIHVWEAAAAEPSRVADWIAVLSPDERERADRFYFEPDRIRYVASRAHLRFILGDYLDQPAGSLRFQYSSHGKPSLLSAERPFAMEIAFNVSHSEDLTLLVFAAGRRPVGIDVEKIRPGEHLEQLVGQNFSPRERTLFRALPAEDRLRAFYNGWTRKEAFVKAVGEGLSFPLQDFSVTLQPGSPVRLLSVQGSLQAARGWRLEEIEPRPGYVGAVCGRGQDWDLIRKGEFSTAATGSLAIPNQESSR